MLLINIYVQIHSQNILFPLKMWVWCHCSKIFMYKYIQRRWYVVSKCECDMMWHIWMSLGVTLICATWHECDVMRHIGVSLGVMLTCGIWHSYVVYEITLSYTTYECQMLTLRLVHGDTYPVCDFIYHIWMSNASHICGIWKCDSHLDFFMGTHDWV